MPPLVLILFCAAISIPASAQTFTSIANFDGTNGTAPASAMVQAVDGNLYGTTSGGARHAFGSIFQFSPSGTISSEHSFCERASCNSGSYVTGGLTLSNAGALWGAAGSGGSNQVGTFFEFRPSGLFHVLYAFCSLSNCADGDNPYSGPVQATDGNFYGVTYNGGANSAGEVFKITPNNGVLTTLYSFCALSDCADGQAPPSPLIQAANGNFYGSTAYGGANGSGTLFELTPAGALTTLYNFCAGATCPDGRYASRLMQASKGDFYGTTNANGANSAGTIFKLTSTGSFITLYTFCSLTNCTDGSNPNGELIQAPDGYLYGTTQLGGTNNAGTIFRITVDGVFTTLHNFDITDGEYPDALMQATDGNLYGTTSAGGTSATKCSPYYSGCGTVFRLSLGFAPFIKTLTNHGKVGSSVVIYGTNLTGATGVTFNGASASFTVVSPTQIIATVPAGATNGKIQVITPTATLSTTTEFHVRS